MSTELATLSHLQHRGTVKVLSTVLLGTLLTLSFAGSAYADEKEQYAIVLKPVPRLLDAANWTEEDNQAVASHFQRLKAFTETGKVILAGRTLNEDASQFGLIIVEVGSEAEAREIMDQDPAVKAGVMTAELFPYRVALMRAPEQREE